MKVKTFTAPTTRDAMNAATREMGENVVLLESVPPRSGQPARITVLADEKLAAAAAPRPVPVAAGAGAYAVHQAAPEGEEFAAKGHAEGEGDAEKDEFDLVELRSAPHVGGRRGGRRPLFTAPAEPAPMLRSAEDHTALESIRAELAALRRDYATLDARLSGAVIGASNRWVAHPLFQKVLATGLRPETAAQLFNAASEAGLTPDSRADELTWAIARELKTRLENPPKPFTGGAMAVMGFAGSGKTSMLLRIARHPSFFGRRSAAVLSVLADETEEPSLDPAPWFRQYGVPVQTVRNETEMAAALRRVSHFDHVLIDTPPLSTDPDTARRSASRIRKLLQPLLPVEVHFVMNATRELPSTEIDLLRRLPLQADCIALSHLDETRAWGRVAEWVTALKKPARFISNSRRIPDGLAAFNTAWFVEQMLEL